MDTNKINTTNSSINASNTNPIRTILVPATGPGPMWHGVVEVGVGRFRQIVGPNHVPGDGKLGEIYVGWYEERRSLSWEEAIRLLVEAMWEDEALDDEGRLRPLAERRAAAEAWLKEMGY